MAKDQKKVTQGSSAENNVQVILHQDIPLSEEQRLQINQQAFAVYIRSLMQNWRQGTVGCKSRGEVAFSTKKPWKQKGTGRARAGTRRSPLWRKGGIVFGPQPRVRTLKIGRAIKQQVLGGLLWQQVDAGNIMALDWTVSGDQPKTSGAHKLLKAAGLADKRVVLFVAVDDYATQTAFNNLSNVQMMLFDQPNAYALARGDCWIFLNKDREAFKQMVSAWM